MPEKSPILSPFTGDAAEISGQVANASVIKMERWIVWIILSDVSALGAVHPLCARYTWYS